MSPVLSFNTDATREGSLNLLIDTGATCSIIKLDALKPSVNILQELATNMCGINGKSKSLGVARILIEIKGCSCPCDFQVVEGFDRDALPWDGILGMNFLQDRAVIDCISNTIEFSNKIPTKIERKELSIRNRNEELEIEQKMKKHEWEKHSRGVGRKIMLDMGYIPGEGLGKHNQGMAEAIVPIRSKFLGKGLSIMEMSNDIENIENEVHRLASISLFDKEVERVVSDDVNDQNLRYMPIVLEPRTENIVKIQMVEKGDRICKASEIRSGIYVSNTIVRPTGGVAWVGMINSTGERVTIDDFSPDFEPLDKYFFKKYGESLGVSTNDGRRERTKRLHDELDLGEDLSEEERTELESILNEFNDIFHLPGDKLTHTKVRKFRIPLNPGAKIVNRRQYRLPEVYKEEVKGQISKLLEDDIIEPSTSPFNSPIILVPKKGVDAEGKKQFRLCVDFRELNKTCVPYSFPLPRIEDILDRLGNSRFFSTLDLSQGFHQVEIEKDDREKTAFSTNFGHYQYKRCPFGLSTIPGFFQSLLNSILTGLQGIKCFVYLDDVVIFARTLNEHNDKLTKVFSRFRESGLKLNPRKCAFLRKEIVYLGHLCSVDGVKPNPGLVKTVQSFPIPRTVKHLRSFLGLANYYRRFIKDFSKKAKPLTELLKKDVKFEWSNSCQVAFDNLKVALTTPPVLAYPDFSKPFDIICDASSQGFGAILEQEGKVIAYASRVLTSAESRWPATELELGAIVFACKTFKTYVLGVKFRIFSDHMPLKGCIKVTDTTARTIRLLQKISEFDYEVVYKKGKENSGADCLSRIPLTQDDIEGNESVNTALNDEFGKEDCLVVTRNQARNDMMNDANKVRKSKESCSSESSEDEGATDDPESMEEAREAIVDPAERQTLMQDFHSSVLGGHFGVAKTYGRMKEKYFWKGMKEDISNFIKKCEKCQLAKTKRHTKMPLVITDTSLKPFDKIFIDIVGPLPETLPNRNKYILSMLDDLTKFVEFTAIPDQQSNTVGRALFEDILCRYNIPKLMVTDNGANFTSNVIRQLCKLLGVETIRTTPYHPQSNAVERQHSTLGNYLRCFVDKNPTNWDCYLKTASHAYNNTVHAGTGFTPMQLLFGFNSEMPTNLKRKREPIYNYDMYHQELRNKLQVSFDLARQNLEKSKINSKKYYDKNLNPISFHVGEECLIFNSTRKNKLENPWLRGKVVHVHGPENVTILVNNRQRRVHVNRLTKFFT